MRSFIWSDERQSLSCRALESLITTCRQPRSPGWCRSRSRVRRDAAPERLEAPLADECGEVRHPARGNILPQQYGRHPVDAEDEHALPSRAGRARPAGEELKRSRRRKHPGGRELHELPAADPRLRTVHHMHPQEAARFSGAPCSRHSRSSGFPSIYPGMGTPNRSRTVGAISTMPGSSRDTRRLQKSTPGTMSGSTQ